MPKYSKMQSMFMFGGSVALGCQGVGLISYTHWDAILPYGTDILALLSIGASAGLARFATSHSVAATPSSLGGGKEKLRTGKSRAGDWDLEIVPLNDEVRYAAAATSFSKNSKALGGAEEVLAAAESAAQKANDEARKIRTAEIVTEVEAEIEAGVSPRRVRQRLSPRVFVIDFDTRRAPTAAGTAPSQRPPKMADMLSHLEEQVNLLLHVASPYDEVVLRVTSPGGAVADYGHAAASFARLKAAGVNTTACVDLVAASGGYMLACAARKIVAAPFSIIGSIGVIAGVPNVHRLLERGGVEFVQRTAGEYKRTVNVFTPNTEEGLKKFQEDITLIHEAFVDHVTTHRPQLDAAKVCTGETWLALHAEPKGLVDVLCTSEQYLRARQGEADVYQVRLLPPKKAWQFPSSLGSLESAALAFRHAAERLSTLWGSVRGGALGGAPFGMPALPTAGASTRAALGVGGAAADSVTGSLRSDSAWAVEVSEAAALGAEAQMSGQVSEILRDRAPLLRANLGGALGADAARYS